MSSQSLSFYHRLHYPWEYRRFFSNSEALRFSEFTLFRVPNALGHFRLGITLKARGSSVERNRIKRQIREGFRILGPDLGSYDYNVVIPSSKRINYLYSRRLRSCIEKQLSSSVSNT